MRILHVVIMFVAIHFASSNDFVPIYVHTATWYVKIQPPPKDLSLFLGLKNDPPPDLIVVTLQGVKNTKTNISVEKQWTDAIFNKLIQSEFIKITSVVAGSLCNYVYQIGKYEHFHIKNVLNSTALSVEKYPEPSALVTTIGWFGRRITFINTKFTGKENELETRFWEFYYIDMSRGLYYNDHVFWMGRLNFRVEKQPAEAKKLIDQNKLQELLAHDQLKKGQRSFDVFIDWLEQDITFRPNYMFNTGTDNYKLDHTPSWTDRILYKTETNRTLDPLKYQSLNYKEFSQRPVTAQFSFNQPARKQRQ